MNRFRLFKTPFRSVFSFPERHFALSLALFVPAVDAVYVPDADEYGALVRMLLVERLKPRELRAV